MSFRSHRRSEDSNRSRRLRAAPRFRSRCRAVTSRCYGTRERATDVVAGDVIAAAKLALFPTLEGFSDRQESAPQLLLMRRRRALTEKAFHPLWDVPGRNLAATGL